MVEQKFVCPFCGFESNGPGLCPTCDENLEKVCNCGSGKFSAQCCGSTDEESKETDKAIEEEVTSEVISEIAQEDQKKIDEEEELAKVEEVE